MSIYIFILLLIVFISLITNFNSSKVVYLRKLTFPFICILFIVCLIIFSDTAVKSAIKGITLWLFVVFPSLFPFFVGSELLNKSGFVKAVGTLLEPIMRPLFNVPGCGSFTFAIGITSGYPVGAKITVGMREEKLLTRNEAERLLAFTNNSGPLFIIGAVAVGMYSMPNLGLFLLACHILSCITVGLLFRFYKRDTKSSSTTSSRNTLKKFRNELLNSGRLSVSNLGNIFGDAIRSSVNSMLSIGGFIIFFSVIINLLIETGLIGTLANQISMLLKPLGVSNDVISAALCGIFEITTGTNLASQAANVPFIQQLTVTSMIIGWAGFSVHSQVMSIIGSTDISIRPYLIGKLMQGMFAGAYTYVGIKLTGHLLLGSEPAFISNGTALPLTWNYYLSNSCKYFFTLMGVIIAFTLFSLLTGYLFGKNKRIHK